MVDSSGERSVAPRIETLIGAISVRFRTTPKGSHTIFRHGVGFSSQKIRQYFRRIVRMAKQDIKTALIHQ
ncbi:MAG TPA: hypothetical protein VGF99_10385 [Myxococcota bacterium]